MKRGDGSPGPPLAEGDSGLDQFAATVRRATSAASRSGERSGEAKAYPLDTSILDRPLTEPDRPLGGSLHA